MSRATTDGKGINGGRLRGSGRRQCNRGGGSGASAHPDPRLLRFLAEHRALPVDLTAALIGCSNKQVEQMIKQGAGLGWIRSYEYPGEPCPWASLEGDGWTQAGRQLKQTWRPSPLSLPHRREVLEARLILRDEKPGWAWITETDLRPRIAPGRLTPDAMLKRGELRWAIEVEQSGQLTDKLRKKLHRFCGEYDRVIDFAAPPIRAALMEAQAAGEFQNLEVRPLPSEPLDSAPAEIVRGPYEPSADAREMLAAINEEGVVARAQLARLLGWDELRCERALDEVEKAACVLRRLDQDGAEGWIWCNRRGTDRSGTDFAPPTPPGRGWLMRRVVLMEVRLSLLAEFRGSKWLTRRRLRQGCLGNRSGLPDGVLEWDGRRFAVIVIETRRQRESVARLLNRWKGEYAGVLCYRTKNLTNWMAGLVSAFELDWIDLRDLPVPPADSPFGMLEDESPTAEREGKRRAPTQRLRVSTSYVPTREEVELLSFANAEGSITELQSARILRCSDGEAEAAIGRMKQHGYLLVRDGWIRCTKLGAESSGISLSAAHPRHGAGYLDECFQVMEVRLSFGPASHENWKTRRQLGKEFDRDPARMPGLPPGAVLIGDEWHAIGVFFGEIRRRALIERLSRWSEEFAGARCYCMESDVERFQRLIGRWELSSVEALPLPVSQDRKARERQEAQYAALISKRERRAVEHQPQVAARQRVRIALQRGKLEKPDVCERCNKAVGGSKLEGHHDDYSKPLEVRWLCMKCHRIEDRAMRAPEDPSDKR